MILVYNPDPMEAATITALRDWIESCYRYNPTDLLVLSLWANYSNTDIDDTDRESAELNGLIEAYNIPPSLQFNVSTLNGEGIMDAFNRVIETVISTTGPLKRRSDTIGSELEASQYPTSTCESKQKCSC